jgi:hypothetical protein
MVTPNSIGIHERTGPLVDSGMQDDEYAELFQEAAAETSGSRGRSRRPSSENPGKTLADVIRAVLKQSEGDATLTQLLRDGLETVIDGIRHTSEGTRDSAGAGSARAVVEDPRGGHAGERGRRAAERSACSQANLSAQAGTVDNDDEPDASAYEPAPSRATDRHAEDSRPRNASYRRRHGTAWRRAVLWTVLLGVLGGSILVATLGAARIPQITAGVGARGRALPIPRRGVNAGATGNRARDPLPRILLAALVGAVLAMVDGDAGDVS